MQINTRLKKVEIKLKTRDSQSFKTVVFVDAIPENKGVYKVSCRDKQSYEGNREEIEAYLEPYYQAGSTVIWDDILQD